LAQGCSLKGERVLAVNLLQLLGAEQATFLQPFGVIQGTRFHFCGTFRYQVRSWALKKEQGANALLDLMDEAKLPWLFEEASRPSLVAQ
jgi:hypothetical protein